MKPRSLLLLALILAFVGCSKEQTPNQNSSSIEERLSKVTGSTSGKISKFKPMLYKAEYLTTPASGKLGKIVVFKDVGNKQIGISYVPGDPRRGGRMNITYAFDKQLTTVNALTAEKVGDAINSAVGIWAKANCTNFDLTRVNTDVDLGSISNSLGLGGSDNFVADVDICGFLPVDFFNDVFGADGPNILAVTFFFIWTDENGNPTDINHDGDLDFALAEIYVNNDFSWNVNGSIVDFDIETVIAHEFGHGLAQSHFGTGRIDPKTFEFTVKPRALMNAVYLGVLRELEGTDNAGHCSIWANWPAK